MIPLSTSYVISQSLQRCQIVFSCRGKTGWRFSLKQRRFLIRITAVLAAAALLLGGFIVFPETKTFAAEKRKKLVGVDVSDHNGTINWAKVKKGGIDFAIIRIGWGDNVRSQDDAHALYNMQQCEKYNIPYGVYIYSYALKMADVDSEVAHMIRMTNGHTPALGYWFDMEDGDAYYDNAGIYHPGYKESHGLNPYKNGKTLTNFCVRFLQRMKAKGFENVGVYANPDYFYNVLNYNKIKNEGMIWLAHWGVSTPSSDFPCEMWQYALGRIPGGGTMNFDLDIIYSDSYLYPYAMGGVDGNYQRVSGMKLSAGDLDGDGAETAADLALLKKRLFTEWSYQDSYVPSGINSDGTVSLVNLARLKRTLASSNKTQETQTGSPKDSVQEDAAAKTQNPKNPAAPGAEAPDGSGNGTETAPGQETNEASETPGAEEKTDAENTETSSE